MKDLQKNASYRMLGKEGSDSEADEGMDDAEAI